MCQRQVAPPIPRRRAMRLLRTPTEWMISGRPSKRQMPDRRKGAVRDCASSAQAILSKTAACLTKRGRLPESDINQGWK
eukprot:CAMPEP_0204603166 /NCGR_PEP_ID=MMETSP0661-20131031/57104_1 /ASSEMBLY_ACC=CAM_ASM_000606 /TAXON_ID=109239 /ORGANISM="Alexandrium margalefi, Strain AMGDE01CS-322" /LENGTH=78 /DNA_ID=CAMNT_0051614207 /DNA_START=12 /DNA_END=248 /DNA_ORIENTATION=+